MDLKETYVILISTPLYVFLIGAEIVLSGDFNPCKYSVRGIFENFNLMLLNMEVDVLMRAFTLFILCYFFAVQIFKIEYALLYWFVLLILEDFMFYWHYL